jgi:tRNA modification GTPase
VIEITCHGSPLISTRIIQLCETLGARHAQPGEFTQRAVLNGRMSIQQAEAVHQVISAESERARRLATDRLVGKTDPWLMDLRQALKDLYVVTEALTEFPDDELDLEAAKISETMDHLLARFDGMIAMASRRQRRNDAITAVLVGPVNAGKSSLFNALLGEARSIVHDVPGTTRDVIEADIDVEGYRLRLVDTAGLRDGAGQVEAIGIARTQDEVDACDVVLQVWPADWFTEDRNPPEIQVGERPHIRVATKADLVDTGVHTALQKTGWIPVSIQNPGEEVAPGRILATVAQTLLAHADAFDESLVINQRVLGILQRARAALAQARTGISNDIGVEFLSSDIDQCNRILGEITGDIATDEVFEAIFSEFCIGK